MGRARWLWVAMAAMGAGPVDVDTWERQSLEVEALLKKELCPALQRGGGAPAGVFTPTVAAPDLAAAEVRESFHGGFAVRRLDFGPPAPRRAAELAAAFDVYLADIAVRKRCSVKLTRFQSHEAVFDLLLAGDARGGGRVQDGGEVRAALTRHEGRWRIAGLALEPRVRVAAARRAFVDVTEAALGRFAVRETSVRPAGQFNSDDMDRGGLAVEDIDGDGDLDLYVGVDGPNLLFLNRGDGTFTESAARLGVADGGNARGVLLADLDGDGDRDLLVANRQTKRRRGNLALYRNDGARFSRRRGFLPKIRGAFTHLAAGDVDADGDLDVHVSAYGAFYQTPVENFLQDRNGAPDLLLINEGGLGFVESAEAWGVKDDGWTFAAVLVDLDGDSRPELVAADDYGRKRIYRNEGGTRFVDVSVPSGLGGERANGMGVAVGDVDGDGALDLYFANMYSSAGTRLGRMLPPSPAQARIAAAAAGNTLWLAREGLVFQERAEALHLAHGGWAWGVLLPDIDLDGRLEAFSPCGYYTSDRLDEL